MDVWGDGWMGVFWEEALTGTQVMKTQSARLLNELWWGWWGVGCWRYSDKTKPKPKTKPNQTKPIRTHL